VTYATRSETARQLLGSPYFGVIIARKAGKPLACAATHRRKAGKVPPAVDIAYPSRPLCAGCLDEAGESLDINDPPEARP
jgi:hypothetical protein